MHLLCVWKVASTAKKSAKQWIRNKGKSFINNKNRVGPKIDPGGTPERTFENFVNPDSHSMALIQFFDLHQLISQPTRVTKTAATCTIIDHVY